MHEQYCLGILSVVSLSNERSAYDLCLRLSGMSF